MRIGLAGLTANLAPPELAGSLMAIMRWIVQIVSALATAAAAFTVDRAGYAVLFVSCLVPVAEIVVLVDDEPFARAILRDVRDVDVTRSRRFEWKDLRGLRGRLRVRTRDPRTLLLLSRRAL